MSEITTPAGEPIELSTKDEVTQRMNELEARGVPVEHECHDCDATFDHPVLPEETDGTHVSICKDCAEEHLRTKDLL